MMKLPLIAAAVLLVAGCGAFHAEAARPKWHQLTPSYSYEQFLFDQGKTAPASSDEYAMRKGLFLSQLRECLTHNQQKGILYHKGINHMSDYTEAEKKRMRGGKITQMAGVAEELNQKHNVALHKVSGNPLPRSFDVRGRSPSIVTAVKDQGMCGS